MKVCLLHTLFFQAAELFPTGDKRHHAVVFGWIVRTILVRIRGQVDGNIRMTIGVPTSPATAGCGQLSHGA